jgi:hypothetical protein
VISFRRSDGPRSPFGRFRQRILPRTAAALGSGHVNLSHRSCLLGLIQIEFRRGTDTDRGRQDHWIERSCRRILAIAPGAAFSAGAEAALRTGLAHEGIVRGIGHRLALIGADWLGCDGLERRLEARLAGFALLAGFPRLAWFALFTRVPIFAALSLFTRFAVLPRLTLLAGLTVLARLAVIAGLLAADLRAIKRSEIGVHAELHRLVFRVLFRPTIAGLTLALFVNAHAAIRDHAEVMVRELQIILGLDAVTIQVRVLGQLAILFEHLGRVAPRAAVDPVKLLTATLGAVVVPAPTSAVVVPAIVVVQVRHFPVSVQPRPSSFQLGPYVFGQPWRNSWALFDKPRCRASSTTSD